MTIYITYLFEANCTLLICGLFYFLFLKKETDFRGRRYYLLGSTILALVIPVLNLAFLLPEAPAPAIRDMQAFILPELIIGEAAAPAIDSGLGIPVYIYVYSAVALLLFCWFLFQIGQVVWFYAQNRHKTKTHRGYTVLKTNGTLPTFSFFHLLFLDNSVELSHEEEARIIAHEEAHIKENHSFDIVLLEISKILFWFNPVAWFFRREVQDIHEYLADAASTDNTSTDDYSSLLAKMALNKAHLPIGHHFNKSKTLKRIKMMKTTKTKIKKWKWLSTLSLAVLILVAFSCNDEAMNDLQKVMDESAVNVDIPEDMQARIDKLKLEDPEGEYVYLETSLDNEDEVARLKELDPKTIAAMNVNKVDRVLGMIVKRNGTMNAVVDKYQQDNEVFVVVEDPATPVGGMSEFYSFIASNLKYPAQAQEAGIEGKVYVQMIIDKDGSVADVSVVKGIGYGCDEEALRVLSQSPAWNPGVQRGKKVKQKVIVPLVFSLDPANGANHSDEMKLLPSGTLDINAKKDGQLVWGTVKDDEGKVLAGVNIVVQGTNMGTVSDIDGTFKIKLPNPSATLNFSFVGYETVRKSFE